MIDCRFHSYVPLSIFSPSCNHCVPAVEDHTAEMTTEQCAYSSILAPIVSSCSSVRLFVHRVQRHVCGHTTYTDIKTLLTRTDIWNEIKQHYLSAVMSEFTIFRASAIPPPNTCASISSLSRSFNAIVTFDHMFMGNTTLLHRMYFATWLSSAYVVNLTALDKVIISFDSSGLLLFGLRLQVKAIRLSTKRNLLTFSSMCLVHPLILPLPIDIRKTR